MSEGLLSLQWNNHKFTLHQMLSSIRKKKSYTDTTLACDGLLYPVHKIVLSMCSKYFEEIFVQTQGQHPVIILKDIKRHELECLLNYMYIGEVNVPQEKLAGLIKAAECLQIKGLAVPDEEPLPATKSSKAGGGEKRGREESQTSEAKKRKQDVCSDRNLRNSRSLSPVQGTAARTAHSKESNESSAAQSSKGKISFKNQQKNSESFSTSENSKDAVNELEESSSQVQELSSLKEEVGDEEEAEESYVEPGPEGTAIKEEPIYLSDSNSNDGQQQHMLLSADTLGHEGSQMHFMEQLLANEAASESLADDGNSVREGSSSDAQLCSTVGAHSAAPPHDSAGPLPLLDPVDTFLEDSDYQDKSRDFIGQEGLLHHHDGALYPTSAVRSSSNLADLTLPRTNVCLSPSGRPALPSSINVRSNASKHRTTSTSSTVSSTPSFHPAAVPYDSLVLEEITLPNGCYKCPVCSAMCPDRYSFRRHYMIHTGEKPFKCQVCPYRSNQKINVKIHMRNKHGFEMLSN